MRGDPDSDVEAAESQLNVLIERRSKGRDEANAHAAMWAASERRHRENIRAQNREAWAAYYRGLARSHHALAAENAARADAVEVDA
jgi:hypothetical protein